MPSVNRDSLFLPFQLVYILFHYFIALGRTSRVMLKSRGQTGHPCFVPDHILDALMLGAHMLGLLCLPGELTPLSSCNASLYP